MAYNYLNRCVSNVSNSIQYMKIQAVRVAKNIIVAVSYRMDSMFGITMSTLCTYVYIYCVTRRLSRPASSHPEIQLVIMQNSSRRRRVRD